MASSSPAIKRPAATPTKGSQPNADTIAQIQADMRHRAAMGSEVRVEEYRAKYPHYRPLDPIWLSLLRFEALLEVEQGHVPQLDHYQQRFPHWSAEIRAIFTDLEDNAEIPAPTQRFAVPSSAQDTRKEHSTKPTNPLFPRIPGYEILEIIGRGGMGIVYKARQTGLNRIVALKMILSESNPTEEDHQRFRQEAEAVAALKHPNIVQIFEIGEHAGSPFFSLEYIAGGTLNQLCQGKPQDPAFAAELVASLADAVQAAHAEHIVHRDLKPGNILIARDDPKSSKIIPKITDFGLAKRLDCARDLTSTGVAAGTPVYMAPEQVSGKRGGISEASDVWALGVILYELTTGRPPFMADNAIAIMNMVASSNPQHPRQIQSKLPVDLETICLKCLEKSPHKRYTSAAELAEDLRRFLAGRSIQARRVNASEQLWRWARRNPVIAALLVGIGVVLLAGTSIATVLAINAQKSADEASVEKMKAESNAREAVANEQKAIQAADLAAKALKEAERQTNEANRLKAEAIDKETVRTRERDTRTRELYAADAVIAHQAWRSGQVRFAKKFLTDYVPPVESAQDIRGFEWYYLDQICRSEKMIVDLGLNTHHSVAISPDGQRIVVGSTHGLSLIFPNGSYIPTLLKAKVPEIVAMCMSPDGKRLATANTDGTLRIWDTENGDLQESLPTHDRSALSIAWSKDGTMLASSAGSGYKPGQIVVWDLPKKAVIHRITTADYWPTHICFSPDSKQLACGTGGGQLLTFDIKTGQYKLAIMTSFESITSLGYCDWNNTIVTGTTAGVIACYDPTTGSVTRQLRGHQGAVMTLAFDSKHQLMASGSSDGIAMLWNVETGEQLRSYHGHDEAIRQLTFDPNAGILLSVGHDGKCHFWDALSATDRQTIARYGFAESGEVCKMILSRDGKKLLVQHWDLSCQWIDVQTRRRTNIDLGLKFGNVGFFLDFELMPDENTVLANTSEKGLVIRALDPSKPVMKLPEIKHLPRCRIKLSSDGKLLVTGPDANHLQINHTDGSQPPVIIEFHNVPEAIAISSGASPVLAAVTCDGMLSFWDANSGKRLALVGPLPERVMNLELSPDGRILAGGGLSSRVWMWDARTGAELFGKQMSSGSSRVRFNSKGDRLVAACDDRTVKVLDVTTGRQTLVLQGHRSHVVQAMFTKNDDRLISSDTRTMMLWDAASSMIREKERFMAESLDLINLRVDGDAKAGGEMTVVFDLINRAKQNLPVPVPGQPMNKMYVGILLEPVGKKFSAPLPTMGNKFCIADPAMTIGREIRMGEMISDRRIKASLQHLPPGEYRLTAMQRFIDPRIGSRSIREVTTTVTLR